MRRLTICLAAFLLIAWTSVAQDTSGSQEFGSTAQDSAAAPQPQKTMEESSQMGDHHKYHLRLGTMTVGAGYFSGLRFYPYGPYGWYPYYRAAFWDPFWGPYSSFAYLPNLAYATDKGEIRLAADPKQAEVYIDGAYAGTADHLKTIWLDPGAYDLSVSHSGRESFHQRLYILTGKSLKIAAKLAPQSSITGTKEEKQ